MKLTYILCGEKKTTEMSNDDIDIINYSSGENLKVAVRAKKELTLDNAEEEINFKVLNSIYLLLFYNYKQLVYYFLKVKLYIYEY